MCAPRGCRRVIFMLNNGVGWCRGDSTGGSQFGGVNSAPPPIPPPQWPAIGRFPRVRWLGPSHTSDQAALPMPHRPERHGPHAFPQNGKMPRNAAHPRWVTLGDTETSGPCGTPSHIGCGGEHPALEQEECGGIGVRNFPQFSAISQFSASFRNLLQFSTLFPQMLLAWHLVCLLLYDMPHSMGQYPLLCLGEVPNVAEQWSMYTRYNAIDINFQAVMAMACPFTFPTEKRVLFLIAQPTFGGDAEHLFSKCGTVSKRQHKLDDTTCRLWFQFHGDIELASCNYDTCGLCTTQRKNLSHLSRSVAPAG